MTASASNENKIYVEKNPCKSDRTCNLKFKRLIAFHIDIQNKHDILYSKLIMTEGHFFLYRI